MQLRKVLNFNTILGVTLPKEYTNALRLNAKDYVEVALTGRGSIEIKKHEPYQPQRGINGTEPTRAYA